MCRARRVVVQRYSNIVWAWNSRTALLKYKLYNFKPAIVPSIHPESLTAFKFNAIAWVANFTLWHPERTKTLKFRSAIWNSLLAGWYFAWFLDAFSSQQTAKERATAVLEALSKVSLWIVTDFKFVLRYSANQIFIVFFLNCLFLK